MSKKEVIDFLSDSPAPIPRGGIARRLSTGVFGEGTTRKLNDEFYDIGFEGRRNVRTKKQIKKYMTKDPNKTLAPLVIENFIDIKNQLRQKKQLEAVAPMVEELNKLSHKYQAYKTKFEHAKKKADAAKLIQHKGMNKASFYEQKLVLDLKKNEEKTHEYLKILRGIRLEAEKVKDMIDMKLIDQSNMKNEYTDLIKKARKEDPDFDTIPMNYKKMRGDEKVAKLFEKDSDPFAPAVVLPGETSLKRLAEKIAYSETMKAYFDDEKEIDFEKFESIIDKYKAGLSEEERELVQSNPQRVYRRVRQILNEEYGPKVRGEAEDSD